MGVSFGGLISGIDTESIISAIVDARRFQVTSIENRIAEIFTLKDSLQVANSQFLSLQRASLNLRLESTFLARSVTVSNPTILSARATTNAVPGNNTVTVSQLARGAQAISGLNSRALDRGVASLTQGNTAGISGVSLTSTTLAGTRALASDNLRTTLQAGRGDARVTEGDTIRIQGTRKDTTAVDETFTFTGDDSDSLQRLANAIEVAFGGDVDVTVGSSGQLKLTEADLSVGGDFTLTALTFNDADLSGSTFDIGLGPAQASGGAVANELTGTVTFTTGNSATIATAATLLDDLDQLSGGTLDDGLDTININLVQPDGTVSSSTYTYTAGDTLQDLLDDIDAGYGGDATASIVNGRIVITDAVTGESETALGLTFVDDSNGNDNSLNFGAFVVTKTGADETAQVAHTTIFEVPAEGRYDLTATDGKAGAIVGTVSLNGTDLLGSFAGLTELNRFTIDRDTGAAGAEPLAILGLSERSTVQDLVDAINIQIPSVTASLVDDGSGAYNLQISGNQGGTDLRLTDVAGGILDTLFDPTAGIDTDVTTATSTTDSDDVTFVATFTPGRGGATSRTVVSQDEGTVIDDLIENVELTGFNSNTFTGGSAVITTDESSELNLQPASAAVVFGRTNISDAANTTTPPLNIFRALDEAGFAATVEDTVANPDDHVDGIFSINGVQITIPDIDTTVQEVLGLINASGAGVVASYDQTLDRIVLQGATPGAGGIVLGAAGDTSNFLRIAGLTEGAGGVALVGNDKGNIQQTELLAAAGFTLPPTSGTFTINGITLTVDTGADTLDDLIDKINRSAAGVTASYDPVNDRVVLTQDLDAGTIATQISVGAPGDTSNILSALRFTDAATSTQFVGSERATAQFTVDGINYTRNTNIVDDVIPGVEFTLLAVSDDPVSITVANDEDRALEAIAEFVASYNESIILLNPDPLTDDEREFLEPLSDQERATLTFTEIDERELARAALEQRDIFFRNGTVRRAITQLRRDVFDPIQGATPDFSALNQLGIETATNALGQDTGLLVTDSTNVEEIVEKLRELPNLITALREDAQSVSDLFAAPQQSEAEVVGTLNASFGFTITERLQFAVGDNLTSGTVTFDPGTYSTNDLINRIQDAVNDAGLQNSLDVRIGAGGKLTFERTEDSGKAIIAIQDLGGGASLLDTLGVASGTVIGPEAREAAGIGRRIESTLKDFTGIDGILNEQITVGGLLDLRLNDLARQLEREQDLLDQFEVRTRAQFVALETTLARFQRDQQFIETRLQQINNQQQ